MFDVFVDEKTTNKVSSTRDQMQLPLTKENDSSEDAGRRNVTSKENTQQESPPKIREFVVVKSASMLHWKVRDDSD